MGLIRSINVCSIFGFSRRCAALLAGFSGYMPVSFLVWLQHPSLTDYFQWSWDAVLALRSRHVTFVPSQTTTLFQLPPRREPFQALVPVVMSSGLWTWADQTRHLPFPDYSVHHYILRGFPLAAMTSFVSPYAYCCLKLLEKQGYKRALLVDDLLKRLTQKSVLPWASLLLELIGLFSVLSYCLRS